MTIKQLTLLLFAWVSCPFAATLEAAYNAHLESIRIADSALKTFAERLQPMPDSQIIHSPSPTKELYSIFRVLWKPDSIDALGKFESWGISDAYKRSKYILIQNTLPFTVVDDRSLDSIAAISYITRNAKGLVRDTLRDFRPQNTSVPGVPIYLSPSIIDSFADFLQLKTQPRDSKNTENNIGEYQTLSRRGIYLRELMVLVEGHFGGWMLPSFPWVDEVFLSSSGTKAYVKFVVRYQGGIAKLSKKGGVWKIDSSKQTWIQ